MSAPSIPNLLSLRGSRGGGRGRGRGRGGGPGSPAALSHDATIQGTDTDAAVSRLSAVDLGYLDDPFAQFFVQNTSGPNVRRLPIINRGTYTRTTALDRLTASFLGSNEEKQIISLGAGTDTRSLRLFPNPTISGLTYHEIDFPAISSKKRQIVQAVPMLQSIIPNAKADTDTDWSSELSSGCRYYCHGLDLRDLVKKENNDPVLQGLRPDVPTLLISECCLCYLETTHAKAVIKYFTDRISDLGLVIYEPVKPDDPFGRQMVSNLAARHIRMPSLDIYRQPDDQETRLKEAGFESVKAMTVEEVWDKWVSESEKERVDSLEGLDEVEEWKLLAGHYVVSWGWRGRGFEGWKDQINL